MVPDFGSQSLRPAVLLVARSLKRRGAARQWCTRACWEWPPPHIPQCSAACLCSLSVEQPPCTLTCTLLHAPARPQGASCQGTGPGTSRLRWRRAGAWSRRPRVRRQQQRTTTRSQGRARLSRLRPCLCEVAQRRASLPATPGTAGVAGAGLPTSTLTKVQNAAAAARGSGRSRAARRTQTCGRHVSTQKRKQRGRWTGQDCAGTGAGTSAAAPSSCLHTLPVRCRQRACRLLYKVRGPEACNFPVTPELAAELDALTVEQVQEQLRCACGGARCCINCGVRPGVLRARSSGGTASTPRRRALVHSFQALAPRSSKQGHQQVREREPGTCHAQVASNHLCQAADRAQQERLPGPLAHGAGGGRARQRRRLHPGRQVRRCVCSLCRRRVCVWREVQGPHDMCIVMQVRVAGRAAGALRQPDGGARCGQHQSAVWLEGARPAC